MIYRNRWASLTELNVTLNISRKKCENKIQGYLSNKIVSSVTVLLKAQSVLAANKAMKTVKISKSKSKVLLFLLAFFYLHLACLTSGQLVKWISSVTRAQSFGGGVFFGYFARVEQLFVAADGFKSFVCCEIAFKEGRNAPNLKSCSVFNKESIQSCLNVFSDRKHDVSF